MSIDGYKARAYTALVFYPARADGTRGAARGIVAPDVVRARFDSDVAPYGTLDAVHEVVDAALLALADMALPAATRKALYRLLTWADEIEESWVVHQLEPSSIAGQGIADIESDPAVPRG